MKCPHCDNGFFDNWATVQVGVGGPGGALRPESGVSHARWQWCPLCRLPIIQLGVMDGRNAWTRIWTVHPAAVSSRKAPEGVPPEYASDFNEASLVLPYSPKASAALSRRCLQNIIHNKAGIRLRNLSDEIEELLPSLPDYVARSVDAVRQIGNFAAHPIKVEATGEVVEVEPGEADWNLETLEQLFDHFFVKPAREKARVAALNEKLIAAGKLPLKGTTVDSGAEEAKE